MTTDLLASTALGGVVVTPRPFAGEEEVTLHPLPEGLSVLEMIERLEVDGALSRALRPWVRVTVGRLRVRRADWLEFKPSVGDLVVVDVAPMASSNPVRSILQIAVVALAGFTAAALPGVGGALVAAAVNVGGLMAVNAIAPIKQPELAQREQRYSLSSGSNAARPHEAVPIVMGRRRLYPPRCANWYTRTEDNVVYLRMMFQPCIGWVDHQNPRIGQTDLSSYDGVTVRWRTRPDEAITPIWFNRTPAEDSLALPVTSSAGWVTRTAPIEGDTLSIDVAFMAGLFETKESSGNPKNRSVTFEFRYGPQGGEPSAAAPCPFTVGGMVTFTRGVMDSWRVGYEWDVPRGEYDIHIRRVTAEPDTSRISDELTWVCLRAFRNEAAVHDLTGKPWIELELKATEQLQGVPDDFNFIATSMVRQATAGGPGGVWMVSRNPADLYLAASYPPFSDLELDVDERAYAAIAAWRATCVAEGWTCDLAEQSEMSVGELLQRIAATGRARPTLDFGALSVVVDWEKPAPRQMFTARNVSGFQGEVIYPTEVHGLRLRFQNEESDWDDDIITVFADGYDLDSASLYESLDIRDKTNPDEVEWEGARILAERKLRPETFTFEQDAEYLTAKEGQRAWLAHHVALVGQVSGRVMAQVVDEVDADRKGLRLDETVVMEVGRSYDLAWRPSKDAPLQTFALEGADGASDTVWFVSPAPASDAQPLPGDLVTLFEHAVELLDVVIDRIKPKDGLKAEITCVPYAPELQSVGEEPIPAYRTGVSRPPGLASAIIKRRTDRAVDQVLDGIGQAVDEAGKGVDEVRGATVTLGEQIVAAQADVDATFALAAANAADVVSLQTRTTTLEAGSGTSPLGNQVQNPCGDQGVMKHWATGTGAVWNFATDAGPYRWIGVTTLGVYHNIATDFIPADIAKPLSVAMDMASNNWSGGFVYEIQCFNAGGVLLGVPKVGSYADPTGKWRRVAVTVAVADWPVGTTKYRISIFTPARSGTSGGSNFGGFFAFTRVMANLDAAPKAFADDFAPANINARVAVTEGAVELINLKVAAYWQAQVDAGTGQTVFRLQSDGVTGDIIAVADRISLWNTVGGVAVPAMYVTAGKVRFSSDVQIDGSLTLAGTILAAGIAEGQINIPAYAFSNALLNGTGGTQIGLSVIVDLDEDAVITATSSIAWSFPSGDQSWSCDLRIDGFVVFSASGARSVDITPMSGQRYCSAGSRQVDIRFSGNSNVRWAARNISAVGLQR